MVPDGTEQSQVGQNGPRWDIIVPDGIEMSKIGQKAYTGCLSKIEGSLDLTFTVLLSLV